MTVRTGIARPIVIAALSALISGTAAATPFDPNQPIGPVMKGLGDAVLSAVSSKTPSAAALVDTSALPGKLHNPDDALRRYSSVWANQGPDGAHARGQLNSSQAWSAASNNREQWVEIPIPAGFKSTGLVTQGRANANQWVTAYQVQARLEDGSLVPLHSGAQLAGNQDRNSLINHALAAPDSAVAIRITPQSWHSHISMRAALLLEPASCTVPQLISNGSFEQHGPLNRGSWGTFANIPAWTAASGHIELQSNNVGGIIADDGERKLELDAHHNSHIYTQISTEPGRHYQLSFAYSPRVTTPNTDSNDMELWWDDALIATYSGDERQWQHHKLRLRATQSLSRLEFRGAGRSDGLGGYVDSVALSIDPNLIGNGSFENHPPINNGAWAVFDAIDSWSATNGKIELQLGRTGGIHALHGAAKLELDAYRNSTVATTVDTHAGAQYTLSFAYSPRASWPNTDTNNAELWWEGQKIYTLSGDQPGWQHHTLTVTASSARSELSFKAIGRSDGLGALIDDVSVVPRTNLLNNGGFEQHGRLNRHSWGTFEEIPGWQSEQGKIEIQRHQTGGIAAFSGRDKLELDAHGNSTVSTRVATTAGASYQLRLAYSPRVERSNTDTNDIQIWWDGQLIDTLSGDERGWTLHHYPLTASGTDTTLRFKASGRSDGVGGLLDELQLLTSPCTTEAPGPLQPEFISPSEGEHLQQSQPSFVLDIHGTDTPNTELEIEIDGQRHTVQCIADQLINARLHCDAPAPLSDGEHQIIAHASAAGVTGSSAARLFYTDTRAPSMQWLRPTDGSALNEQPLLISGTLDPSSDRLSLNGQQLALDAQGHFDTSLTLTEGSHTLTLLANDLAGNTQSLTRTIHIDRSAPEKPSGSLIDMEAHSDGKIRISGTRGSVEPNSWVEITNTRTGESISVRADAEGAFSAALTAELGDQLTLSATDAANNTSPVLENTFNGHLPPDPLTIAPPLPTTAITPPWEQWAFIHSGTDPIQRELDPGALVDEHLSLLRGTVLDMDGEPLPGVRISIKDHPEYGHTLSRLDGMWDMVINGGGVTVVDYQLDGYLPLQRKLDPNWLQAQYADDVVMTPLDDQVTEIDTSDNSKAFHVATGAHVTDRFGERKLHMLFPAGTQAHYKRADGTLVDLDRFHVRATEYTVGDLGPNAMPGELPRTSAYTYALELTLDEAVDAVREDGVEVWFDNTVNLYLDNFAATPTGTAVPVGYYDHQDTTWRAETDGIVVTVLSIDDGLATVSLSEDNSPASQERLQSFEISDAERAQMAQIYAAGESFWRIPTTHFSTFDYNFLSDLTLEVFPPDNIFSDSTPTCSKNGGDNLCGSSIDPYRLTVAEQLPLSATEHTLHYTSANASAYAIEQSQFDIDITGDEPPSNAVVASLIVTVGGKQHKVRWSNLSQKPNFNYTFRWDGKDVYERDLVGSWDAQVRLEYAYTPRPRLSGGASEPGSSWATAGTNGSLARATRDGVQTLIMARDWNIKLTAPHNPLTNTLELGGWTLSDHHQYYANSGTVMLGSGETIATTDLIANTVQPVIKQEDLYSGDDTPEDYLRNAFFSLKNYLPQSDGSIIATLSNSIVKIEPDGRTTRLAGSPVNDGVLARDGMVARDTHLHPMHDIAIKADGTIYGTSVYYFFKVDTQGKLTLLHTPNPANRDTVWSLTVNQGGELIVCDAMTSNLPGLGWVHTLYRINPQDEWEAIAQKPNPTNGEGYYPINLDFSSLDSVDRCGMSWEDNLFVFHGNDGSTPTPVGSRNGRGSISEIDLATGEVTRGYSNGDQPLESWYDGMPATDASTVPREAIPAPQGGMYWSMGPLSFSVARRGQTLWYVDRDDRLNQIAGRRHSGQYSDFKDGDSARATNLAVGTLAIDAEDRLLFNSSDGIYAIDPAHPGTTTHAPIIPAPNGNELWHFDLYGRHQKTTDSGTGVLLRRFEYSAAGQLSAIVDRDGLRTTIERDSAGRARSITAADGQITYLDIDSDNRLSALRNGVQQEWTMAYHDGGLLASFTTPNSATTTFEYDDAARLISDTDPDGGGWRFAPIDTANGSQTTATTALGRTATYEFEQLSNGKTQYTRLDSDGSRTRYEYTTDGTTRTTTATGTTVVTTSSTDPQLGALAPLKRTTVTFPSGLQSSSHTDKTITGANALSPDTIETTRVVNGRSSSQSFDKSTGLWTLSSAQKRQGTVQLNALGRVTQATSEGLAPTTMSYRSDGRLQSITSAGVNDGSRTTTYDYFTDGDQKGYLASITDALNRRVTFERDAIGRVTNQTLPDGRRIGFSYDANGNLDTLTPPGRSAHVFLHDDRDLPEQDTPPELPEGFTLTQYQFNKDKQLELLTRPGDQQIDYQYNATTGQLDAIAAPRGRFAFTYNPTTAQLDTATTPEGDSITYGHDGDLPTSQSWAGQINASVQVDYTSDLIPREHRVNDTDPISYTYDNDLLITRAGDLNIRRTHPAGLLTNTTLGSVTTSQSYNDFGELKTLNARADGEQYKAVYTRDALGRITTRTETIVGVESTYGYSYDTAGRLEVVKRDGVEIERYTYDANSNRTSAVTETDAVTASSINIDSQDRLTRYSNKTFTYTQAGELKTVTESGQGTTTYNYDNFGNLRSVTLPNNTQIQYITDASHRRIGKKVNGNVVQGFLYQDQLNPIAELDGNGSVVSRFVYGTRPNVPDYLIKGENTYRIIADHLGSPRLVIDIATNTIVQRMDFNTFGNVTQDTNPGFQPFGFAGGIYDRETGLTRFGARDYDPTTGRWTAKDPIGFAGGDPNLYGYVAVDPVNFVDPSGEIVLNPLTGAVGGAVAGAIGSGVGTLIAGGSWGDVFSSTAYGGATGLAAGFVAGFGPAAKPAAILLDLLLNGASGAGAADQEGGLSCP